MGEASVKPRQPGSVSTSHPAGWAASVELGVSCKCKEILAKETRWEQKPSWPEIMIIHVTRNLKEFLKRRKRGAHLPKYCSEHSGFPTWQELSLCELVTDYMISLLSLSRLTIAKETNRHWCRNLKQVATYYMLLSYTGMERDRLNLKHIEG